MSKVGCYYLIFYPVLLIATVVNVHAVLLHPLLTRLSLVSHEYTRLKILSATLKNKNHAFQQTPVALIADEQQRAHLILRALHSKSQNLTCLYHATFAETVHVLQLLGNNPSF